MPTSYKKWRLHKQVISKTVEKIYQANNKRKENESTLLISDGVLREIKRGGNFIRIKRLLNEEDVTMVNAPASPSQASEFGSQSLWLILVLSQTGDTFASLLFIHFEVLYLSILIYLVMVINNCHLLIFPFVNYTLVRKVNVKVQAW